MKAKLLKDGGYSGLNSVKFPVIVECTLCNGHPIVSGKELMRISGSSEHFIEKNTYLFMSGSEAELVRKLPPKFIIKSKFGGYFAAKGEDMVNDRDDAHIFTELPDTFTKSAHVIIPVK